MTLIYIINHRHLYIINCKNINIKSLFNKMKWKELTINQLDIPFILQDIAKELA